MPKPRFILALLFPALLFLGVGFCGAEDLKQIHPTGYVTDLAGVVRPDAQSRLEALCTELEQKTGVQMAIVTVHSLEGESVEDYAVDLFKQLGVGSKKDSRGVLLLIAPGERKYRIEVGYGLEPVITDARAGDTGRAMVPALRANDFSQAAEMGAWQLAQYIAQDAGVTLSVRGVQTTRTNSAPQGNGIPIFWLVFAAIIFFGILGSLSGRGGRGPGGSGCLWFLLGMMANSSGGRSGSTWGGGGFGGSGGGFGGFGGGSSGGGGASGSW